MLWARNLNFDADNGLPGIILRHLFQLKFPVCDAVQSTCDMLSYDVMYLACEGRVVAVVVADVATTLLVSWQNPEQEKDVAITGNIDADISCVLMRTDIGGERILE